MASATIPCLVVLVLLVGKVWTGPAHLHELEFHPPLSELRTRLASLTQRETEPRLPLPTPQEIEAIKKVAQILVMLGEQVIPAIVGEPPSGCCDLVDVPNNAANNP